MRVVVPAFVCRRFVSSDVKTNLTREYLSFTLLSFTEIRQMRNRNGCRKRKRLLIAEGTRRTSRTHHGGVETTHQVEYNYKIQPHDRVLRAMLTHMTCFNSPPP